MAMYTPRRFFDIGPAQAYSDMDRNSKAPAALPRYAGSGPAERLQHRRRRWAIVAVCFPLFFFVVVAAGLLAMANRRMEWFRPAPASGMPAGVPQRRLERDPPLNRPSGGPAGRLPLADRAP
jgi:hypothetical protein